MSNSHIVSTAWLADRLDQNKVKILDGSFYLPAEQRDAEAEYAAAHIPGAQRFNIDKVCAPESGLPHMFPSEEAFADAVGAMGISNDDMVVTYDGGKLTGACRVWWMFRAFGHDRSRCWMAALANGGPRAGPSKTPWPHRSRQVSRRIIRLTWSAPSNRS